MAFFPSSVQQVLQQRVSQLWQRRRLPQLAQRTCELYLDAQGPRAQTHCREILQTQVKLDSQSLQRFFRTEIGESLLDRLSQLIELPNDAAGRHALVQRITKADQLSIMSLLYQIAGNLRTDRLLETAQQIDLLLQTTDQLLTLLKTLMLQESVEQEVPAVDPRLPGPWGIRQKVLHLQRRSLQPFQVFLYEPVGDVACPVPVVVISHGLAANPQAMTHYAKHLVSHGYLVAVPQHPGSDTHQVQSLLTGSVDEIFSLQEFFARPHDVSALLDELERRNGREYDGHLNLTDVGILGESFGGYTALALAGATIDFEALAQRCESVSDSLNVSLLLQCRALSLSPTVKPLQDPRIKAIFAVNPIGSGLFGAEGLASVTIPTVIATGSSDKTAPMALEPLQMFPQLASQERFLAVIRGKSHVHDLSKLLSSLKLANQSDLPTLKLSPPIIDSYLCGLSILFFKQHLQQPDTASLALSAYSRSISQAPYDLHLISAKSAPALQPVLNDFQQRLAQLKWQTITAQYQDGLFTAADGLSLYYQSWLPTSTVRATVILLHGLGGHSGLFQNVVKALLPEGYALYGYDLRGHGRSPGQRGHINRWSEYRNDLAYLIAMVQQQHPTVPCFLISHSLGSIVALEYVLHRQMNLGESHSTPYPKINGIVVASPPFGNHATTDLRLKIGQLLSLSWPRFSMSLGLGHILPSRDRSIVLAYAHDPLRHQRGTARLATEFIKTIKFLRTHKTYLTLPLLILHGMADKVADPSVSQEFFEGLPQRNKTFISYEGAYHELYNEINQTEIMKDINNWLEDHVKTN
ncbi:lysophospholipase [Leptolyngbya sp. Heron Island J]|uniref:alpha/beta fold hydrolase n=1 Tax=Leptolyngbya sp. Heron Island J TaxID=1385935 RepID=UPI0003B9C82A|nr:alpha/beta fold hydrolase [Leptolyngbya sp. Heron Island J]ESA34708.1 lysophospholipase [Leptolyngbya sp. Heron Island J]